MHIEFNTPAFPEPRVIFIPATQHLITNGRTTSIQFESNCHRYEEGWNPDECWFEQAKAAIGARTAQQVPGIMIAGLDLWCDEEGLFAASPQINETASLIAGQPIVGDCFLTISAKRDEDGFVWEDEETGDNAYHNPGSVLDWHKLAATLKAAIADSTATIDEVEIHCKPCVRELEGESITARSSRFEQEEARQREREERQPYRGPEPDQTYSQHRREAAADEEHYSEPFDDR